MAEEEARNVSENVKWNVRKRFSEGKFYMVTRGFLGYTLDEHGNLIIDETEATIVRAIYEKYTQGIGVPQIVKWLNENQVKTTYNYGKWYDAAIYNILKNEKYTGNALLQKTMRPSFKSKNKVKNETLPMYYVENSHTPIITQELFEEAQSIRLGRIKKYHSESTLINKEKYIAKSKYSGLVKCGECGRSYIHRLGNQASPYSKEIMVCIQNKGCKTCPGDNISVSILEQAIQNQVDYIIKHKKAFLQQVYDAVQNNPKRLELVRNQEELGKKIEILEERKCGLKEVHEEFSRMVQAEIEREITSCRLELANTNNLLATTYSPDRSKQQIQEILYPYIKGKEIDVLVPLLFESITVNNQRLLELRIRHVNGVGKEKTETLNVTYTIRKEENRLEHYVVL
jgi:site-specific DNA recombinase